MNSPVEYPNVDPLLVEEIKKLPKLDQVQYSTNDQLKYLIDIAAKFGLYDGMNAIQNLLGR
jgi:hypothetical protein